MLIIFIKTTLPKYSHPILKFLFILSENRSEDSVDFHLWTFTKYTMKSSVTLKNFNTPYKLLNYMIANCHVFLFKPSVLFSNALVSLCMWVTLWYYISTCLRFDIQLVNVQCILIVNSEKFYLKLLRNELLHFVQDDFLVEFVPWKQWNEFVYKICDP